MGVLAAESRVALVGRDRECDRIDHLVARARCGEGGALIIIGEAGIGKSALLDIAAERAGDALLLRATGVQAEAELPYATLQELLRPTLGLLEMLPHAQADALASALALASPQPFDRFAVGAATLSLLAAAAENQVVVALVDDIHWADSSSREALFFAARRLRAERVLILFTVRESERKPMTEAGLAELELSALGVDDCRALIARARGGEVASTVADQLCAASGGNPLALLQLASLVGDAVLAGRAPLAEPLPPIGIEERFLARAADLPNSTRGLLVVAAASDCGAADEIAVAALALGLDPDMLTPAEERGLVSIAEGALRFQHPLLRSALYHHATGAERRQAHAALADALRAKQAHERRAWHLAAATTAPEESVAAALTAAGETARSRGDHAVAATALERAARLTPKLPEKIGRLLGAAEAALLAGRFDFAAALADEALAEMPPGERIGASRLRAAVDLWRGRPLEARHRLLAEAERVESDSPEQAAAMLLEAAIPAVMSFDFDDAVESALRSQAIADRADMNTQALAAAVAGACFVCRGDVPRARPLLERGRPIVEVHPHPANVPPMIAHFVWHFYILLEWYADAERLYDTAIHEARKTSMPGLLPFPLAFRAELHYRTGNWHRALADASESAALAEQTGQWTQLPHSLAVLARLEAARGDRTSCSAHCQRALSLAREHGSNSITIYAALAVGLLELGVGRNAEAAAELEAAVDLIDAHGLTPAAVPVHADFIEACIRGGRRDRAEDAIVRLERWASRNEHSWTLAACARCRGLIAPASEIDACFHEALAHHARTATAFEQARTLLAYGERLRRVRRLVDARKPLHSALAAFDQLGARPWADRARAELRAARDVPRQFRQPGVDALTAQELHVARAVADGLSNREAAAALFLSPKTIDFHLRNIYRKLDIGSRAQLTRLLGDNS